MVSYLAANILKILFCKAMNTFLLFLRLIFLSLYDLVFIHQNYEEVNRNEARYLAMCH